MGTLARTGRCGSAAVQEAAFFRERGHTPAPRFIQWMATLRCPMRCAHCLAAGGEDVPDMPLADVARLLDQVAAMNIDEFLVTGGEPAARPDLAEVVGLLRERNQRWSLNTAAIPNARARAAMETWPPSFVAVSLDGPERVHDRFRGLAGAWRESLEAIRFYRRIVKGEVVAGTTVTRRNFDHLAETFDLVAASGATSWGLHLLVPEGRAAKAPKLFLKRRDLRALLDFCAARRRYFPVGMADEIGYLGAEGPLVRDEPFFCGAGRTQCVILPDGEVVPCTTLDRSTSAGNVLREPLEKIWREGFAELRAWEPEGRCRSCEYASACRGGCWLQRRAKRQCSRDLWRTSRFAATAAGMAVALGLGSGALAGEPEEAEPKPPVKTGPPPVVTYSWGRMPLSEEDKQRVAQCEIERWIIEWYTAKGYASKDGPRSVVEMRRVGRVLTPKEVRESAKRALKEDPAAVYFLDFTDPERDKSLAARCKAVRAGLYTKQVSLSLAAFMWRDLTEACLDGPSPEKRTAEERKLLRETLGKLQAKSLAWQKETVEQKLGAFLYDRFWSMRGLDFKHRPPVPPQAPLASRLREKRWGHRLGPVAENYAAAHPFGGGRALTATCEEGTGLVRLTGEGEEKLAGAFTLGIFDVLRSPKGRTARVEVVELAVDLPAGAEVGYADVLRLVHEAHREKIGAWTESAAGNRGLGQPHPALLPALRIMETDLADKEDKESQDKLRQVRRLLTGIWLF